MDAAEAEAWLAARLAEVLTAEEAERVRSALEGLSRSAPGREYSVRDILGVASIIVLSGGPVNAADLEA